MAFQVLWGDEEVKNAPPTRQLALPGILPSDNGVKKPSKRASTPKKEKERGCAVCPLNKVKGVQKILGEITGKPILVVAQSPGPEENEEGRELVGRSGEWFWTELKRVGIRRKDVDIQNAVKCFPADWSEGSYNEYLKMRNPSAEEIRCCSIHTETALAKSKAKHILVLGQVAAKALLKTRSIPQQKIFWSDELQAKVYLLDHPAFFIRGYGQGPRLEAFRQTLEQLVKNLQQSEKTLADRFAFVRSQDYRLVLNKKQALEAKAELEKYRGKRRIGTDIENAEYPHATVAGPQTKRQRIFACGFSPKPGQSLVFVFRHNEQRPSDGDAVREVAISILCDSGFEFAYQYGCSDVTKWLEYEGVSVVGFTHDTQLSEYLRNSDKKAYGLEAIAESRFPEFSGYKLIITKDLLDGASVDLLQDEKFNKAYEKIQTADIQAQWKFVEKHKLYDLSKLSLDTLRVYNGADCDLTKRIEVSNKKHIPQPLMQLYIDLSFLLYKMEPNGPLFDYEQEAKLMKIYPWKEKRFRRRLNKVLGRTKENPYNPGSPQQVYKALFSELKLEFPYDEEPNTRKRPLMLMAREHKFPKYQLEWRSVSKVASTVNSYRACADNNEGRLRTKWWATGTRTGRYSSGGTRKKKDEADIKVINLQNIKKDPQIQNLCVADLRWREFYRAAKKIAKGFNEGEDLAFGKALLRWVRESMPDLKTYLLHDYGQVEVRVFAKMSGDKNLKKDCEESDIHTRVGVTITGWSADEIANNEQVRTLTKNCHFGILFNLRDENLYQYVVAVSPPGIEIDREMILTGYKNYFKRYPGVRKFQKSQQEFGRENSYVETLFGMKQHLQVDDRRKQDMDEFFEEANKERGSHWQNQAVNGPVQGTAHQLLACGEVNLIREPEKYKDLGVPPLEVHDMLGFVVDVLKLKETYTLSKEMLEKESLRTAKKDFGIDWDVPIVTEAKAGLRLGCKVKLKDGFSVSEFLVSWFRECRKQEIALNKELALVPE
jgi:uracil-DNA glycosylase family 4